MKLCGNCRALLDRTRRVKVHASLMLQESRHIVAPQGDASERDYECLECGTQWMNEPGTAGMGWMLRSRRA